MKPNSFLRLFLRRPLGLIASCWLLLAVAGSLAAPIFDTQGALRAVMSLVSNQASLVSFPNPVLDDLITTAKRTSQRLGWQADNTI